jgi:hypothetical protein
VVEIVQTSWGRSNKIEKTIEADRTLTMLMADEVKAAPRLH